MTKEIKTQLNNKKNETNNYITERTKIRIEKLSKIFPDSNIDQNYPAGLLVDNLIKRINELEAEKTNIKPKPKETIRYRKIYRK